MNDTVSVFFTIVLETLCPFTTKSTLSPTSIPGAFNLKAPVSSNLEVSIVFPFFLISIVEDGVAYPVTNPEFATTIPNSPRLVVLSIAADLKPEPAAIAPPLRESRAPEFLRNTLFANEFLTGVACFNNVVNSSTVAEALSNCAEMLSNICSASVAFALSVAAFNFSKYS